LLRVGISWSPCRIVAEGKPAADQALGSKLIQSWFLSVRLKNVSVLLMLLMEEGGVGSVMDRLLPRFDVRNALQANRSEVFRQVLKGCIWVLGGCRVAQQNLQRAAEKSHRRRGRPTVASGFACPAAPGGQQPLSELGRRNGPRQPGKRFLQAPRFSPPPAAWRVWRARKGEKQVGQAQGRHNPSPGQSGCSGEWWHRRAGPPPSWRQSTPPPPIAIKAPGG